MATAADRANLQKLYIAYFGRAAEPAGLNYWMNQLDAGVTLNNIGNTFAALPEAQARFSFLAFPQLGDKNAFITSVYQALFNRAPDAAGLAFWAGRTTTGNAGQIIFEIINNAGAGDIDVVNNRVTVSNSYTDRVVAGAAYDTAQSVSLISSVTATASTVTAAQATIAALEANGTVGSTFTLTTGADNITGTVNADTINAYVDAAGTTDTLTASDTISGGAGTDTLNITVDGAAGGSLPAATISGIEIFRIKETGGTAGTYDFATITGETQVINNISTDDVTFNNLASGTKVQVNGDGTATNGATTFTMASTTDAVNLTVSGGHKTGSITRNQTGAATVTVNSVGAANTIGTLDLDTATALTGLTINATTNLTASLAADYATSSKLTISGTATLVDLSGATLSANIATVDASGMTAGGASVILGANTATFTGGTGADTVSLGGLVFNTTGTVNGGAGTDIFVIQDAAQLTSTTAAKITNMEVLRLADDNDGALDTFDASLISGLTGIQLNADSAGDGYSITNMSATLAGAVTIRATQAVGPTFAVTGASTVGQIDTLSIAIDDGASTAGTVTVANVNAAGVENITFANSETFTLSSATGLGAMTKMTITGAGNSSITTDALALNVNSTIDASASTGTFTIDASAGTANGLAIKGSSTKANTITGTNQDDAITGGTGVDTVKNQANAATDSDTVDFVSDSSADVFEITTLTGKTTISNFDVATTTTTEDLVNVSNNNADGAEVQITAAAAQAAIATDTTYVIEQTVGAAASLRSGGTATLAAADFTATTLTNLATFLSERFTGDNDTVADEFAVIVLNNGTNSYIYAYADSTTANTTIDAGELTLIGVVNSAVLNAGDVFQTV